MEKITFTSKISHVKNQVSCDLAGEAVILSLDKGIYYTLNPVGARIWNITEQPVNVEEIQKILLSEYDVEARDCEVDLLTILEDLAQEGLIEFEN